MQYETNTFDEKNYTNPRLIEVKNQESIDLYKEILGYQQEANPDLEELENLQKKMQKLKAKSELITERLKEKDQLATKVKEKLAPLLEEEMTPQMGDFEEFFGIEEKDGRYFAKINDRIEEFVKVIRAGKKKDVAE